MCCFPILLSIFSLITAAHPATLSGNALKSASERKLLHERFHTLIIQKDTDKFKKEILHTLIRVIISYSQMFLKLTVSIVKAFMQQYITGFLQIICKGLCLYHMHIFYCFGFSLCFSKLKNHFIKLKVTYQILFLTGLNTTANMANSTTVPARNSAPA
jgi:hypothetical protein